jgi:hypothetical protein
MTEWVCSVLAPSWSIHINCYCAGSTTNLDPSEPQCEEALGLLKAYLKENDPITSGEAQAHHAAVLPLDQAPQWAATAQSTEQHQGYLQPEGRASPLPVAAYEATAGVSRVPVTGHNSSLGTQQDDRLEWNTSYQMQVPPGQVRDL